MGKLIQAAATGIVIMLGACSGPPSDSKAATEAIDLSYQDTLLTQLIDAKPGDVIEI